MKPTKSFSSASQSASSRPVVLALIFFALGIVLASIWFQKHPGSSANNDGLSEQARDVLAHLQAPVSVKFYSILPAGSASEDAQNFSSRVGQLLDSIQSGSNGKVSVTTATDADAASTDGIQAFNMEKGDACFLGLSISSGGKKETIARLQPEWESALPYDIVRAISRVATPPPPPPVAAENKPKPEVIESVKKLVPDINATSVEDADRIFHQDFVEQCATVGAELEKQIAAAQEKVVEAQNSGSAADLEAAGKNLSEVQLAQGEKLKEIAARLQAQLEIFRQMKSTNTVK